MYCYQKSMWNWFSIHNLTFFSFYLVLFIVCVYMNIWAIRRLQNTIFRFIQHICVFLREIKPHTAFFHLPLEIFSQKEKHNKNRILIIIEWIYLYGDDDVITYFGKTLINWFGRMELSHYTYSSDTYITNNWIKKWNICLLDLVQPIRSNNE